MVVTDVANSNVPRSPSNLTPPVQVVRTSQAFDWKGIVVEELLSSGGDDTLPAQSQHMICLYLGEPGWLEQERDNQIYQGVVSQGNAQIVPAGKPSRWKASGPAYHMHLLIQPDFLTRLAAENTQADPARIEVIDTFSVNDPQIEHLGRAFLAELQSEASSGRLYSDALATALTVYFLKHYSTLSRLSTAQDNKLSTAKLRRVLDYVQSNLAQDISLEDLANLVNLSQSHFTALFRQSVGLPPHQYLIQQRIERAQHLLRETNLAITDIAAEVGFYDQSHLTRHMRRLLKVSPRQLRDHA